MPTDDENGSGRSSTRSPRLRQGRSFGEQLADLSSQGNEDIDADLGFQNQVAAGVIPATAATNPVPSAPRPSTPSATATAPPGLAPGLPPVAPSPVLPPGMQELIAQMQAQQALMTNMLQILAERPVERTHVREAVVVQQCQEARPAAAQAPTGSSQSIPAKLQKELDAVARNYTNNIRKYMRSRRRTKKAADIHAFLEESTNAHRYPPSVRPFRTSPTFAELDEKWSQTAGGDYALTVTFPANSKRRDALKIMHFAWTRIQKQIDLEASREHTTNARQSSIKASLANEVKNAVDQFCSVDRAQSLGLDDALTFNAPPDLVNSRTDQIYSKAVKRIKAEEDARIQAEKAEKEKAEKKDAETLKKDPQKLLEKAIEKSVASALTRSSADNMDVDAATTPRLDEARRERAPATTSASEDAGAASQPATEPDAAGLFVESMKGSHKGAPRAKAKAKAKAQPDIASPPSAAYSTKGASKGKNGESPQAAVGHKQKYGKGKGKKSKGKGKRQDGKSDKKGAKGGGK